MKACDDIGRNAVHLAAGHTGSTALKLVELLLDNCQEDDLGWLGISSLILVHYFNNYSQLRLIRSPLNRATFGRTGIALT